MPGGWRPLGLDRLGPVAGIPLGLAIAAGTLGLWLALTAREREVVQRAVALQADAVADEIEARFEARIRGLERIAGRWEARGRPTREEWEQDVGAHAAEFPSLLMVGWVDTTLHVRWVAPREGNEAVVGLPVTAHPERRRAAELARRNRETAVTRALDLAVGGRGFLAFIPIFRGERFEGCIVGVFRSGRFFEAVLGGTLARGYGIAIRDGDEELFARGAARETEPRWGVTADFDLHGNTLHARVWPEPATLGDLRSPLLWAVLATGLLFALLVPALLVLAARVERARAATEQEAAERARAEEARRESEERLSLALGALPGGVWDWNVATGVLYGSPGWSEMMGRPPAEHRGHVSDWEQAVHPDDRGAVMERLAEALEGRTPAYHAEYRIRSADGRWKHVLDQGRVVERDPEGRPLRVAGAVVEITERVLLEQRLGQAQKMEAIGQLAGGVAHDFNNLVTAILGYADLAGASLPPGHPARADVEEIASAGRRAAALTGQLLAFARRQIVEPRVVDVNELVTELARLLGRVIGEQVELVVVPAPEAWPVRIDPRQLEQVLVNLAVNARDAMPAGGTLTLETDNVAIGADSPDAGIPAGAYLRITVSDTGSGMDEATLARAFEPFFTTKERGRGTGLGLATAYGIVTQAGGHIRVHSAPGEGATFKIYLPRAGAEPPGRAAPGAPPAGRGQETILVVEDESQVRAMAARVLRGRGYEVLEAENGSQALGVLSDRPGRVDLLLTDVVLPGIGGRELAERVARERPGIRVLYMSGYTEDAVVRHGVQAENLAFLAKPFSPEALAARVRGALDAAAPTPSGGPPSPARRGGG